MAATPLLEFRRERTSGNPPFGWLSARGYNPRALAFRRKTKAPKTKARRIKKLRLLALLGVLTLLTTASFLFGLLTAISSEISALDPANRHEELNGVIYANDGHSVLAVLRGSESRVLVPSSQISPWMKNAIVAIEDRRFYEHRGIDLRGMARALWSDIQQKKVVEGGSTITQQFVKNAYVTNKRSIGRKIREAALAWQLEQQRSKDWILAAYLNTIYFANGAYGVQQASRIYFDKSAKDLTVWEAALLAGIPGDPTLYDPVAHPQSALERRNLVLKDLLDEKYLSDGQYAHALAHPLPRADQVRLPGTQGQAPFFANYVKDQLARRYGARRVYGGGFEVRTTIDLDLQRIARDSISKWLASEAGPTAALVAVNPQDGSVLAMVGGENYHKSQFNLAVSGRRQPGSSFKPFVLATALREGISPSTTFVSKHIQLNADGRVWDVNNYEDEYLGPIDLRVATIHSDNSVYAQLTSVVQPKEVVKTAKDLGITSKLYDYFSIGLGSEAVNPLEMARAFSAFANGGFRIDGKTFENRPRAVAWIKDAHGHVVDVNDPKPVRVLSSNNAAIVSDLLQGVVRSGTGKAAALPDRPVAGKTGTTENYGDAWFVGYTPQLAVAVWVGYPNELRPMLTEFHGRPVAGGTFPALIWKSFMEQALPQLKLPPQPFPAPQWPYGTTERVTVRDGRLELDNGSCRTSTELVFFTGEGPSKTANCKPNEVDVPSVVGKKLAAAKAILAGQPLRPTVVFKPALPKQRLGIVLGQIPAGGTLSSYDTVTLVLAKPLHGVVPRVVGLGLERARKQLERAHLDAQVNGDSEGKVVAQEPPGGVAAAPGMRVTLMVRRG